MQNTPAASDWSSLRSVYRSAFMCSFGFFIVSFLIPIVAYGSMHASGIEVALVFSLLTLGSAIFAPVAGKAAARGLRRECIFAGATVRAAAYVGMASAIILDSVTVLIINSMLWGIGVAFYQVGSDSEISERVLQENRSEAFGRREAANGKGSVIGAFVGFGVLFRFGTFFVFLLYAAMNLIGGLMVMQNRPAVERQAPSVPRRNLPVLMGAGILALVIAASLDTFISALMVPFVELFIISMFNPPIQLIALAYLPAGIMSALMGGWMGRLADRKNRIAIVSVAVAVSSSSSLMLVVIPQATAALMTLIPPLAVLTETGLGMILIAVLFTIQSVTVVLAYTVMTAIFGTAYEGRAGQGFGMYEGATALSRFAGPIAGGVLWDRVSPSAPFLLVGATGYLVIPIYYVGVRRFQQVQRQRSADQEAD